LPYWVAQPIDRPYRSLRDRFALNPGAAGGKKKKQGLLNWQRGGGKNVRGPRLLESGVEKLRVWKKKSRMPSRNSRARGIGGSSEDPEQRRGIDLPPHARLGNCPNSKNALWDRKGLEAAWSIAVSRGKGNSGGGICFNRQSTRARNAVVSVRSGLAHAASERIQKSQRSRKASISRSQGRKFPSGRTGGTGNLLRTQAARH